MAKKIASELQWADLTTRVKAKQDKLISGTNVKTINNTSILGNGNIDIPTVTVDGTLSPTSTNPVQNKVINTALDGKLPDYTLETRPPWTGGVHPTLFCTVDYTNNDSENGSFFKIGMICAHGNGSAFRFLQDIIVNVSYTGGVAVDIYRYFGTDITVQGNYYGRQYGDIFWVTNTTTKVVSFYVLMGQFVRLKSTPYKFLGNTEKGVISQAYSGSEFDGAVAITGWSSIGDLGVLRTGTTRPSFKGNSLALYSDIPSITIDTALSPTSTNPVQNKVINTALEGKVNSSDLATVATSGNYDDITNTPSAIYYATSSTGQNDNTKIATTPDDNFKLVAGATVQVYFTNRCSGSPATLNVDGTGDIRISTKANSATGTYNIWEAGEIVGFTYTGTYWVCWGRNSASTSGYGRTYLTTSATANYDYTSLTPLSLDSYSQQMVTGAPVYSTSATYAIGDRVRYQFKLWQCKTAITSPEAWTSSHWTALDPLQKQIDDLKTALNALKNGS